MDGLIVSGVTLFIVAPLHLAVLRGFDRYDSAAYLREVGVVIVDQRVLDARGAVIGSFAGAPIHASLVFKGSVYRFSRTVPPSYRDRVGRDELYLDPGLIYIAGGAAEPSGAPD
jgi:hypothetical protein